LTGGGIGTGQNFHQNRKTERKIAQNRKTAENNDPNRKCVILMVRALGVIISSTVLLYFSIFPGLQNVVCGTPHETVIALDPNYRYYPFFVKLHRCAGSGHVSPFLRHCVPKSSGYEELNIEVYTKESNFKKVATILVKNHTSCVHECKAKADCNCSVEDWDDDTCTCKCRYPDEPPKELACKAGFR